MTSIKKENISVVSSDRKSETSLVKKELTIKKFKELIEKLTPVEASLMIEDGLHLYPNHQAELCLLLGNARKAQGNTELALAAYARATELEPTNIQYWGILGDAHASFNNHQAAADCFNKICQISTEIPVWARIGLGNANEQLGNITETIIQFRAALHSKVDLHPLRARLIELILTHGQIEDCMDLIEFQAEHEPDTLKRVAALGKLAKIAIDKTEYFKAKEYFSKILSLDSDNITGIKGIEIVKKTLRSEFTSLERIVNKLLKDEKLAEALVQAEIILAKFPDSPEANIICAEAYRKNGREASANELISKVTLFDSTDIKVIGKVAEYHLSIGKNDEAIKWFQKAKTLSDSPLAWVCIGLGNAYENKNEPMNAVANFESALRINSNLPEIKRRLDRLKIHTIENKNQVNSPNPVEANTNNLIERTFPSGSTKTLTPSSNHSEIGIKPASSNAPSTNPLRGYVCFLTNSNSWFFSWKHQWYQLRDIGQLNTLLSAFPLKVFDRGDLNFVPSSGGYIILSGTNAEGYFAQFYKANGEQITKESIVIDESILIYAEWLFGAYDDKWIATSAEMSVEGVKEVEFTFFIPEKVNTREKKISIRFDGNQIFEAVLQRGTSFTTPKLRLNNKNYSNIINITSEYKESNSNNDLRDCGVLVVEIKFNGLSYTPFL